MRTTLPRQRVIEKAIVVCTKGIRDLLENRIELTLQYFRFGMISLGCNGTRQFVEVVESEVNDQIPTLELCDLQRAFYLLIQKGVFQDKITLRGREE